MVTYSGSGIEGIAFVAPNGFYARKVARSKGFKIVEERLINGRRSFFAEKASG